MKRELLAGVINFAHLSGMRRKPRAADDPEDKDRDDDQGRARGEDDDMDDKDSRGRKVKKARRARSEDDDPDEDDEDSDADEGDDDEDMDADEDENDVEEDDESGDDKKSKGKSRSKAESGAYRRGRKAERSRCARIFGCQAAGGNPALAAQLAFGTGMNAQAAIAVLRAAPAAAHSPHQDRADRNPRLGPGGQTAPDRRHAAASSWDRAFDKAGGRRR